MKRNRSCAPKEGKEIISGTSLFFSFFTSSSFLFPLSLPFPSKRNKTSTKMARFNRRVFSTLALVVTLAMAGGFGGERSVGESKGEQNERDDANQSKIRLRIHSLLLFLDGHPRTAHSSTLIPIASLVIVRPLVLLVARSTNKTRERVAAK